MLIVSSIQFKDFNINFNIKKENTIPNSLREKFRKELANIDNDIVSYYFDLKNLNSIIYVLYADEHVIGYSNINDDSLYWNIYEIFIEEEFRELGLGTKIFQYILKESKKSKKKIRTYTLPSDRKAKNFYESNRITARVLIMEEKRAHSRYRP